MQTKVTDEMITRYLCGKATPEEESAVLDYLSERDGRIDDLLAMSAAIETTKQREHKTTPTRFSWSVISAAACVALLIGVGIVLWHNSSDNISIDHSPAYASQDSIIYANMEDTL